MSVDIKTINCRVESDPYRRNTGGESRTELYIDPEERQASVLQYWPGQGGTSMDEYHHRKLSYCVDITPDEDEVEEYLNSDEAQALLDRICDGHQVVWDGHNRVGELSDDAEAAVAELLAGLNELSASEWELWSADDWLQYDDLAARGLNAATTDDELNAIVVEIESEAESEKKTIYGVEEYLAEKRAEMREDEEDEDDEEDEEDEEE